MALKNPQSSFEDGIFGPHGSHPAPKTLPYPTQPLSTLYGDTVEYLIPEGQKERILRKLYPFGEPPAMTQTLMDIHEHKAFVVKDFKVVQQGDYVLLVSPYFASRMSPDSFFTGFRSHAMPPRRSFRRPN